MTGDEGVYIYKRNVENNFFTYMMVFFTFLKCFNFSTHTHTHTKGEMITLLTLALIHIDGFHMPIKCYTSEGQAHDQEAVVQRTLHLLSSFFLSFSTNCMRDRYILTQSNDPPQCRIWNTLIKFSKWNFLQCNQFTCLHRDGDTSETT